MSDLFQLVNMSAGYGDLLAIRDVSISVSPGEVAVVLGPNGAGKTTMLNAAAGLLPTASGQILLDGVEIQRKKAHVRSRMGIALVQENKRVFRKMSIDDNLVVAAPGVSNAELARRSDSVYELFPALAGRRRERAGQLSGGQQQMLAIGQALMSGPSVILLDEPSAGLAPLLFAEVLTRVEEIAATGIAVLLVEQAARQALRVASSLYVLRLGRIREEPDVNTIDTDELLQRLFFGTSPEEEAVT